MQAEEYNRRGKQLVDYITQYLGSVRDRRVIPDVKPGYMKDLIPDCAPAEPEDWDHIWDDVEKVIMPGASSPACTELELNVMDWLCKALGLPSFFLHHHPDSRGGGILQSTVSESTLVALLAARKDKILQLRSELDQDVDDAVLWLYLQAHSSVEKAGLITLVKIRFLPTDEHLSLTGDTLKQAIGEDRRRGLVPFMVCATLGTTGVCAFDRLSELGSVCGCRHGLSSSVSHVCWFCSVTYRALCSRFRGGSVAPCGRCLCRFGLFLPGAALVSRWH
uniref:Histidine decarboxylase n=1 Tax=Sphaeramia orbicularis TaxID=375764 RepID=A0A673BKI9_9TELE